MSRDRPYQACCSREGSIRTSSPSWLQSSCASLMPPASYLSFHSPIWQPCCRLRPNPPTYPSSITEPWSFLYWTLGHPRRVYWQVYWSTQPLSRSVWKVVIRCCHRGAPPRLPTCSREYGSYLKVFDYFPRGDPPGGCSKLQIHHRLMNHRSATVAAYPNLPSSYWRLFCRCCSDHSFIEVMTSL